MSHRHLALAWLLGLAVASCATKMSDEEQANAARVRITNDREPFGGLAQIALAHDVVPVEDRARLMPADLHGDALRDGGPHHVANG